MNERNQLIDDLENDDGVGKEEFYQQLALVERAKNLASNLPKPSELAIVGDLSAKVTTLDK